MTTKPRQALTFRVATADVDLRITGEKVHAVVSVELTETGASLQISPGRASGMRGNRRLRVAAQLTVDLDAQAARSLLRGRSVSKDAPRDMPSASAFLDPAASANDGVRFPIGVLIRPLLTSDRPSEPLFAYQRSGVAWLLQNRRALLADDMGLGKTLQTIAALRRLIRSGAVRDALIVVPSTLLANWEEELAAWAPELATTTVRPEGARREAVWRSRLSRAHVILTTYEQVRSLPATLEDCPDLVIADEAHKLRNSGSRTVTGFKRMRTKRLWVLTGTPVERDAEDLATLLSLLEPSRFSPDDARLAQGVLRSRARPFVLRREKADVLAELPPVLKRHEMLDLTSPQRSRYSAAIHHSRTSDNNFLALFNELRMVCDLDETTGSSAKIDRIEELLREVKTRGEKAIVFSYTLEPLRALNRRLSLDEIGAELFTGELSLEERAAALSRFRKDQEVTALLASSRLASEGLTLVEANNVFFINRWWNPSSNQQAEDRVVRLGQALPVTIYSFTCRHTVEAAIDRILTDKGLTFDSLVKRLTTSPEDFGVLFDEGDSP